MVKKRLIAASLSLGLLFPFLFTCSVIYDGKNGLRPADRRALENADSLELYREDIATNENFDKGNLIQATRIVYLSKEKSLHSLQLIYAGLRRGGLYKDLAPILLKTPLLSPSFKDELSAILSQQHFPGENYILQATDQVSVRVYYKGFYAIIDSGANPRARETYEIPVKLDAAAFDSLEQALENPRD